jgi:hypothetical protein
MNIVCKTSFRDPKGRIQLANQQAPCHIHKGARFSVGGDAAPKDIPDERDREFLARLFDARCVLEATPENISRVESELAMEARRLKRAEEANQTAALAGVGIQALELEQARRAAMRAR